AASVWKNCGGREKIASGVAESCGTAAAKNPRGPDPGIVPTRRTEQEFRRHRFLIPQAGLGSPCTRRTLLSPLGFGNKILGNAPTALRVTPSGGAVNVTRRAQGVSGGAPGPPR